MGRGPLAERLAGAALSFLDSLDDDQRGLAQLSFGDDERCRWHYTPRERSGLALADMGRRQAKAAHHLLAGGLRLPS